MVKFKVTKPGVYLAVKGDQVEQEVGSVINLDCDDVPAFLDGKGHVVGDTEGKELVVSDDLLNETIAENAALEKSNKEITEKLEQAKAELQKATDIVADLAAAKAENEKLSAENEKLSAEVADLKKPKTGK